MLEMSSARLETCVLLSSSKDWREDSREGNHGTSNKEPTWRCRQNPSKGAFLSSSFLALVSTAPLEGTRKDKE
jgi:hypothetical protein